MTVTTDALQALLVAALTRATDGVYATGIGANWFAPRDWPTSPDEMPIGLVQSPKERKESEGRSGAQQFTVTTIIRVIARVVSKAGSGDAGAVAALAALGVLQRQIEVAVINDYDLTRQIQQFTSVDSTSGVKATGEFHTGELVMDFALEFYQGPEDFAPIAATPIEQMAIFADLLNVFSPAGDFLDAEPFDVAVPAPRDLGPDGRPEGAMLTDLPQ